MLNADDALLRAKAPHLARGLGQLPALGWFALDADCGAAARASRRTVAAPAECVPGGWSLEIGDE